MIQYKITMNNPTGLSQPYQFPPSTSNLPLPTRMSQSSQFPTTTRYICNQYDYKQPYAEITIRFFK